MAGSISRWIKEPFCGLSHALGAAASLAGLVVLVTIAAGRPWLTVAVAVYGSSLVLLYTASAVTHSVHCSPALSWRLDQMDYMAIFVLIAGSYTPICLGPLWGPWGWGILAAEWALAAAGIASVLRANDPGGRFRLTVYGVMGWLAVVAVVPICRTLPPAAIAWLVGGGLLYSIGAVVFATNRPSLWPGRFIAHDLWHVFVLAGSTCHFILILRYVL